MSNILAFDLGASSGRAILGRLEDGKIRGFDPGSIGIDSWAVDYGLIGEDGSLLGNPHHYRDSLFDGMMERLFEELPAEQIFARTGIQFLPFNTI